MRALLVVACLLGASAASAQPSEPAASPTLTPTPTPTPSPAATPADDAALLEEIEAATGPAPASSPPPVVGARTGLATSNVYNPAMSVNGLFLGWQTTEEHEEPPPGEEEEHAHADLPQGFAVQEIEVRFLTNVDPYFAADLTLAMHGTEGIELEEGFVTPTFHPGGLGFRFGKMKLPFGRENTLHTHALPFVDRSLASERIFGEEGLSEAGVEVSWLAPLPWYALVSAVAANGDNETLFASERRDDLAGMLGVRNVFDLSPDATLEAGASFAAGNNAQGLLSQAAGAHAVFKWRPARAATTRSAVLAAEVLYAHVPRAIAPGATEAEDVGGAYVYGQWQIARRWHVGGRFDHLGFPAREEGIARRGSAILVFAPSEFSAVRLQGSAFRHAGEDELEYAGFLQLNFTLGAHPAHAY